MTTTDARLSHGYIDNQGDAADSGSDFRAGQRQFDTQLMPAGAEQDSGIGHWEGDRQHSAADPVSSNRTSQVLRDTQDAPAGAVSTSLQAIPATASMARPPAGITLPADHHDVDTHEGRVGGTNSSPPASAASAPILEALAGNQTEDGSAATIVPSAPNDHPSLADPFLALAADVLDDAERTRIANENRLRQLTRTATDADGEERGFGLDESHPDVARLASLVEMLAKIDHQATLNLNRLMRQHPLGAWCKAQKGVGEKQAARLLAVIGDPYWNTLHNRPRTVSELWAYCGLHVFPVSQQYTDTQSAGAGGDQAAAGGDSASEFPRTQVDCAGVAARRSKGQKANWSTTAKTRAYLIAESMLKAGNREAYDKRKAATEGRVHAAPCAPCGPKGKPAEVGSPWSLKHRHVDAMRIQSKELLKELWREAKRLHEQA